MVENLLHKSLLPLRFGAFQLTQKDLFLCCQFLTKLKKIPLQANRAILTTSNMLAVLLHGSRRSYPRCQCLEDVLVHTSEGPVIAWRCFSFAVSSHHAYKMPRSPPFSRLRR